MTEPPVTELMRTGYIGLRDTGQLTHVLVRGRVVAHLRPSGVNHCLIDAVDWQGNRTGRSVVETYTASLRWVADNANELYAAAALPPCVVCGEPFTEDDVPEFVRWTNDPYGVRTVEGWIHMPECARSHMVRTEH